MATGDRTIGPDTMVVARAQQVSVELDDETLILHLSTAGYYRLRKVGARIWSMLERPIRVSEIGEALAELYGVPRQRCEADAVELLIELEKRDLVEVVSD